MSDFLKLIQNRRTIYGISDGAVLSDGKLQELVETAVAHTPSAFNSQTSRVVLLLGDEHKKLWDIVLGTLKKIVPAENFAPTSEKIAGFRAGFATILYFEDQEVVAKMQADYSTYADNFPIWSNQSSGMLQMVIWTALANENVGASLQHYNPLIDAEVAQTWDLPKSWKLLAQMPMGSIVQPAGDKEFMPITERVKIVGKQ